MAEKLHGILEDIGAAIGYTATCSLVDWFGGSTLYIPQAFDDQHAIARVVGARAFSRLIAEWGGETICLPLDHQREINRRDRLIGALLSKGSGTKEVARIACLSERQVQYIRQRLESSNLLPLILKDAGGAAMALDSIQGA